MDINTSIQEIRAKAEGELAACADAKSIEDIRVRYLGRKGTLRDLFTALLQADPVERGALGGLINSLKNELTARIEAKAGALSSKPSAPAADADLFDPTLPGKSHPVGRRHPISQTLDEMKDIFLQLGFEVVTGPEIESEHNNFEALNIPLDHPSRDAFDTFYIEDGLLLRSHTSPVQIRTMLKRKPPLRIIAPGRVFRPDTPDAGHYPMFTQVEGLMVGEKVTFAHLKGILEIFAQKMFGGETKMRFRPSFFPFTEPSAEVDISCIICGGKGCSACKVSGWMEILGAGMVHPKVFRNVGIDPEKYTGFAFGMGVDRIAMLRHRITDIRLLTENHRRFLSQF
ncbi:MAG: phenylalanine--tRNA ligase subunit alpha [Planctomycetes bacterium RBG_16_59_8]|nr:MAG: phenylalanine--tRNA ligase subunit alpha [Planctomycetes bacterium RBG_16_59_8]